MPRKTNKTHHFWTQDEIDLLIHMRSVGFTLKLIARELDFTLSAVSNMVVKLRKNGLL